MRGFPGAVALAAWWHLSVFGLLLPYAAWRSGRRIRQIALPPRKRYYAAVIVQQVLLGWISIGVARVLEIELWPPLRPTGSELVGGLVALVGAIRVMYPNWVKAVAEGKRRIHLIAPRDGTERALWVVISCCAGVFEEISYRGVLFWIVTRMTGAPVAGVVVGSVAFGAGHLVQGWRSAAVITLFAVGFHLLVIASGTLYLAIAVHLLYDVVAGLSYGRLAARAGLGLEAPPPAPA